MTSIDKDIKPSKYQEYIRKVEPRNFMDAFKSWRLKILILEKIGEKIQKLLYNLRIMTSGEENPLCSKYLPKNNKCCAYDIFAFTFTLKFCCATFMTMFMVLGTKRSSQVAYSHLRVNKNLCFFKHISVVSAIFCIDIFSW